MLRTLLPLLLLLTPATARADWHEASTRHFTVYSDQRPEGIREFVANLEKFDRVMRQLYRWQDPEQARPNRLTVYVLDDRDDVSKLAGSSFVAGFYKARAGGSMAVVPRFSGNGSKTALDEQQILLHEYTHHMMLSAFPNAIIPAWYVEGFAELHATAEFDKAGVIVGGPPQYRARTLMNVRNALPAQQLLMADTIRLSDSQRAALYGRGWLLSHYLLVAKQRQGQLGDYLRAINAGKPASEATASFGDLRALDRDLDRYKSGKIMRHVVPLEGAAPEIVLRKLTPGEAATMEVRIRSRRGVNAKTAAGVYAEARKAAAPYPDDPGAQVVLAEAAFDARDFAAAETAADRAIAADPKSTEAYVHKAKARLAAALVARDRSKETAAAIRRIIVAGNKLERDHPELLILYFRTFTDFGQPPTEIAKDGLARAHDLAPQDRMLRFNAARMYLRDGNKEKARALLAPLAYSPHARGLAQRATRLIAQIDASDVEGALKALDGQPSEEPEADGEPTGNPSPAS
ncbi:hypothetical protein [Sphingomonas sp. M1-B02]|uniref:hypothetical protein n=1 Tax=Sphingomonas sp. M1-B02 TaxID=3114300 RepID=UPI0022402952|nr:hypothetical protein [Sphingomonas sp. S6-11]UZK64710.1 hypothetical protein OKW87_09160 [Sphingomonas sp. S6-11]